MATNSRFHTEQGLCHIDMSAIRLRSWSMRSFKCLFLISISCNRKFMFKHNKDDYYLVIIYLIFGYFYPDEHDTVTHIMLTEEKSSTNIYSTCHQYQQKDKRPTKATFFFFPLPPMMKLNMLSSPTQRERIMKMFIFKNLHLLEESHFRYTVPW